MKKTRKMYQDEAERQLIQMEAKAYILKTQLHALERQTQNSFDKKIAKLNKSITRAWDSLNDFRRAKSSSWADLRWGVENSLQDLQVRLSHYNKLIQ